MSRELFSPIHPNARPMNDVVTRVAAALARPWQTSYVAPSLRTVEALVYALRGYDVYWTPVSFDEKREARNPSSVCYRIFKRTAATHNERVPSHGVELGAIFPGWAYIAECRTRDGVRRWRWRLERKRGGR